MAEFSLILPHFRGAQALGGLVGTDVASITFVIQGGTADKPRWLENRLT
jgi:hypothetical protein